MKYAHTKEGVREEDWQLLSTHLSNVADLSERFASVFGADNLGRLIGLCHDVGKAKPEWQKYIRGGMRKSPRHTGAGALLAAQKGPDIAAFPVLGHHGGMPSRGETSNRVQAAGSDPILLKTANSRAADVLPTHDVPAFLSGGTEQRQRRTCEFFVRMLFSCLVDADFLDTERYVTPGEARVRGAETGLEDLKKRFQQSQQALDSTGPINTARSRIYDSVLSSAAEHPGLFSMNIPTGGGKTRTGMGFALEHALHHEMRRIIVVVPYRSIIKQTADVYRGIFGADSVVEHHSGVDPEKETKWNRLAAENWDAPIIVTTSVQFFDSLHSNRPSSCRKLHNIARSVVILDEVQTLPPELIEPILDAVRELVENYGTSFVFSTATQPAFTARPGFPGLTGVREIAPNACSIFKSFQRVSYELPANKETVSWTGLSSQIAKHRQALAIVNTKKDAHRLFKFLPGKDTFHLSGNMCPLHREEVLDHVIERLKNDLPCRLVSTQVVESGVDIDFPVVYRAFGPLDSIVQAAGRCNREGKLDSGRLIVFLPEDGGMPQGAYQTAADLTGTIIPGLDPEDLYLPKTFQNYFSRLYGLRNPDKKGILKKRERMDFPGTSKEFRLIDSDTRMVIVPHKKGHDLAEEMRNKERIKREDFRRLQNYAVSLLNYRLQRALKDGLCMEVRDGLYEWTGQYDDDTGIVMASPSPAKLIC